MGDDMKTIRNILSVIIVIGLVFVELYVVAISNVERFINQETLSKATSKVNLAQTLKDSATTNETMNQVVTGIYGIAARSNITNEQLDAVINSDSVKNFSGTYLNYVADYFMTGEEHVLSGDEVRGVVNDHIDDIVAGSNGTLNEANKSQILNMVNNNASEVASLIPRPSVYAESIGADELQAFRELFNSKYKNKAYIAIVVGLLLLVLIQFSFYKWLIFSGVANAIVGGITCLLSGSIIQLFMIRFGKQSTILENLLSPFSSVLSKQFLITGGIILAIALVQIIIYFSLKRRFKEEYVESIIDSMREEKNNDFSI